MKKHLLKTMLTALILLMGGVNGAWAASDLTTSFEVIGYKAAHLLDFQNKNYDGTAISSFDELPGLGVTAQNTVGSTYGSNNWYDNTSDGRGLRLQSGGGRWIQFTIDIKADDYIIINGGAASEAYEITMTDGTSTIIASASDYLCFKANKDLSALKLTVHRYNYITQILIMTKDATASTADYTINYILGSETVKTSNGNAAIGSTVATDASFFVDDVKYIRVDDEAESFDIAASNNVFTVKVREAETYSYSLLSSLGATLNTGSGYEGETVAVGYPRYQLEGTTLYESAVTNKEYRKAIELTSNNVSTIVDYSQKVENVVFYTEAEMINGMTISTKDNIPVRASNALAAVASEDVEITTLPIGKYTIHAGVFTSKSDNFESVNFGIGAKTFEAMTASNLNEVASDEYTLTISTSVKYLGTTSWADGQFDYIWIEKTGDLTQEEILLADVKTRAQNAIRIVEMTDWNGLSDSQKKDLEYFVAEFKDILNTETATVEQMEDMQSTIYKRMAEINDLQQKAQTNVLTARQNLQALIDEAGGAYEEDKVGSEELATAIAAAQTAAQAGIYNDMLAAAVTLREKLDAYIAANTETGVVYYVKVTDTDDITDGDYLIVYEAGNVAFNGGLDALDAAKNTISVDITEGKIASSDEIDKAVFTFDTNAMSIKSASGYYIGIKSYGNGLIAAQSPAYQHDSFGIDDDGNAIICKAFSGGNMILNFNNGQNDMRFRYYKDGGQQAIQLYKKVVGGEEPPTPITVATPTFAPAETTEEFEAAFDLTMSCDTKDAVIHYTLDGTEPTAESPVYDTPINIVKTTTVKAIAIYKGLSSDLATATYTFKVSGVYYEKVTSTADITDGDYLIVYEGDENNKAVAFDGSLKTLDATNNGIEVSISDNKIEGSDPINAATFTIDVTNGTIKSASGLYIGVEEDKNVLSTSEDATKFTNSFEIGEDDNAVISTTYNNNTKTLRYNAASDQLRFRYFGSGQQPIALYKKVTPVPVITVAAPTFSPEGGEYTEAQTVTLNCETEGATIYYTTNGDTPTADSTPYNAEEPITVSETTTIKAIAVLNGVKSEVATATYTINPPVTTVDLAITKMSVSGTYDMSSTNFLNLYHNVKNNGGIPTNDFVINYYKDDDTVPFYTIDWSSREPLGAGKTETLSINIREFFTTLGKYRLRAELVCENDITPGDNNLDGGFVTLYVRGDANVNGEVTTSDAVAAVSYALEKITPDELQKLSADVDKTGDITVADAQAIVNIALSYEFEAAARGAEAGVNYLTMENSGIGLVNTTGFSAFQMDVTLSDGAVLNSARLTERAAGMLLMTNKVGLNTWRIAALSLDGSTISGSEGALLNLDIAGQGSVSVSNVEFADRAAHAYKLSFGTTTAVNSLYNNKVDGEVYTVSGARSNGVKKGVNIVRQADGSVRKMLVK